MKTAPEAVSPVCIITKGVPTTGLMRNVEKNSAQCWRLLLLSERGLSPLPVVERDRQRRE